MPELFSPASAGADRQGGRHAARDKAADGLQRRLIRAVMVPAVCELTLLVTAVIVTVAADLSVGNAASLVAGTTAAGCGVLVIAYRRIRLIARCVAEQDRLFGEWLMFLRRRVNTGSQELHEYSEAVRRGERPVRPPVLDEMDGSHSFAELARAFSAYQQIAMALVDPVQQQDLKVFVNVARRLQSSCELAFARLEAIVRDEENPNRLADLYGVDHQITQVRRAAESMLVLGGDRSHRISQPVSVKAVLRLGIQEIQHFDRVQVTEAPTAFVHGFAVADVTHLLAELLENATRFSDQEVSIRAEDIPNGLLIEVDDRGLPMEHTERRRLNDLLREPDGFDVAKHLIRDGRSGLFVVARLAQRHGIRVELLCNRYGSTQAAVVLPHALLVTERPSVPQQMASDAPRSTAIVASGEPVRGRVLLAGAGERLAAAAPPTLRAVSDRPQTAGADDQSSAARTARAAPEPTGSSRGTASGTTADAVAPTPGRKPLPRREGRHTAPQLRQKQGSQNPQVTHNPQLAAQFDAGFRAPVTAEPTTPLPAPPHEEMT